MEWAKIDHFKRNRGYLLNEEVEIGKYICEHRIECTIKRREYSNEKSFEDETVTILEGCEVCRTKSWSEK